MNLVTQERYGCGIACVAMIRGISYREAKKLFPLYIQVALRQVRGTSVDDWRRGLRGYAKLGPTRVYKGVLPQKDCIVTIKNSESAKVPFHAIVWDSKQKRFLDPCLEPVDPQDKIEYYNEVDYIL